MVCKIYDPGMISQKQTKNEVFKTNHRFIKFLKKINNIASDIFKKFYKSRISLGELRFGLFFVKHPRVKHPTQ